MNYIIKTLNYINYLYSIYDINYIYYILEQVRDKLSEAVAEEKRLKDQVEEVTNKLREVSEEEEKQRKLKSDLEESLAEEVKERAVVANKLEECERLLEELKTQAEEGDSTSIIYHVFEIYCLNLYIY